MAPIVVGIDGSENGHEALRVALREARLRGTSVRAVHVWHSPEGALLAGFAPTPEETAAFDRHARQLLSDAIAATTNEAAGTEVTPVLREAPAPARALVEEARGAELLVVGSRGLGPLRELALGSVSHACCRHATCPVLVVPPAAAQ